MPPLYLKLSKSPPSLVSYQASGLSTSPRLAGLTTFLESKMLSKYSIFFVSFVYLIGTSKTHHGRPLVSREQLLNSASSDFLLSSRDLPTGTCNAETPCANKACCWSNNLCGYSKTECGTGCRSTSMPRQNVDHMLHRIRKSAP
jgi:hypothetical protein